MNNLRQKEVDMPSLTIGSNGGDHLTLQIVQIHEADWVNLRLDVASGGFHGTFTNDDFSIGHFIAWRRDFQRLYRQLSGEATFETLGQIVQWQIKGNGRGKFDFSCYLNYQFAPGPCHIEFVFEFDQTYIPRFLRELDEIIAHAARETTNKNKKQPK